MDITTYIPHVGMVIGAVIMIQFVKQFIDKYRAKKIKPKLASWIWWVVAFVTGIGVGLLAQWIDGKLLEKSTIEACFLYPAGMIFVYSGYKAAKSIQEE